MKTSGSTSHSCRSVGFTKYRFRQLIKQSAIKLSANQKAQSLLDTILTQVHFLQGIGSGANVTTSGEKRLIDLVLHSFSPPYLIFDVGANRGDFTQLVIDSLRGIAYKIHAFEPSRVAYKELKNKYYDNDAVILNNVAIGRNLGKAVLYYDSPGSRIASLTKRKLDHFNIAFDCSEEVQLMTIDQYCQSASIASRINLIKLDIEGHELEALYGAENMLGRHKIDIISFEFGGCNLDTRTYFRDFWYFCKEYNMHIFRITPSGYLYRMNKYREIYEQFRTTNFVAISDEIEL